MDALLSVLPNLSIGVISVGATVYITVTFLKVLEERARAHEISMQEREEALRKVEREIRGELMGILARSNDAIAASNNAIAQNTKVMERVVNYIDTRK